MRPGRSHLRWVLPPLLLLTGCYSFSQSRLPAHIGTIAIPVLENLTVEPGLEQEITDAVTGEFIRDSSLRVVPEGEADAALYGSIQAYTNRVFGYDADEQTEEYEVVIEVAVEFKDLVKRKSLWKEKKMIGRTTYSVIETPGQPAQDEVSGRAQAVESLAQDIVNRTVRSWN